MPLQAGRFCDPPGPPAIRHALAGPVRQHHVISPVHLSDDRKGSLTTMTAPRHWQLHPITATVRPPTEPRPTGDVAEQLDRVLQEVHSLPVGYHAARITIDVNRTESSDTTESAGV